MLRCPPTLHAASPRRSSWPFSSFLLFLSGGGVAPLISTVRRFSSPLSAQIEEISPPRPPLFSLQQCCPPKERLRVSEWASGGSSVISRNKKLKKISQKKRMRPKKKEKKMAMQCHSPAASTAAHGDVGVAVASTSWPNDHMSASPPPI